MFPDGNPKLVPADVTCDELLKALKSFRKGSGTKPDGLRSQHIKDMTDVGGETGSNLILSLCKLVDKILRGGVNLTALRKKDGGIRPVASGSVIGKPCGKIVSCRL